jgi:Cupin superfamily protein
VIETLHGFSGLVRDLSKPEFLNQCWRKRHWYRAPDPALLDESMMMIGGPDINGLATRSTGINVYVEFKNIFRAQSPELPLYLYQHHGATLYMYVEKPQKEGTVPRNDAPETPLSKARREIARTLGCNALYASVFAVRPPTLGTPMHFDNNENITVQLRGTKRWSIASAPVVPHCVVGAEWNEQLFGGRRRLSEFQFEEVLMEPGAALYVPRGHLHEVSAVGDEENLSFNLSVPVINWTDDIVASLREMALEVESLRQSPNAHDGDLTTQAATALEQVRAILDGMQADQLVARVRRRLVQ